MVAEERRKEILDNLSEGVVEYDEGRVVENANAALKKVLTRSTQS